MASAQDLKRIWDKLDELWVLFHSHRNTKTNIFQSADFFFQILFHTKRERNRFLCFR